MADHPTTCPAPEQKAEDGSNPTTQPTPIAQPAQTDTASTTTSQSDQHSGPSGRHASEAASDATRHNAPRRSAPSDPSSWSASSDRQLGHSSSPDPSDRVFPIRSVVTLNSMGRTSSEHDYFPRIPDHGQFHAHRPSTQRSETTIAAGTGLRRAESQSQPATSTITSPVDAAVERRRKNTVSGPMSSVQADAARHSTSNPLPLFQMANSEPDDESLPADEGHPSQHNSSTRTGIESLDDALVTTRFQHVMTEDGHAVITGRDSDLQRCEDEPIHTPGAIQGFGVMVAIREESDGRFLVRYASENTERLISYTPQQLFRLPNFLDLLTEEQQDNLLDHIDFIRDEDADPAVNGPEVFSLSIRPPGRKTVKLWCAIHINPAHPDLIICEFEFDDDKDYPLRPPDETTPGMPQDTLQSDPTMEELTDSTEILSKPLRVLRTARKRRGEAGAMQVFDIMSQVQEQLAAAPTLDKFLKILVGIVKELTGFHRVMVYQFDSSYNGKVVTELVDTTHTRDLYNGLHFPASDIPRQARELYKLNKVRLLYDRDVPTARLVCRTKEDLDIAVDMSHSYLRAMSPIHLKYLANMAVRSSMSISINAFDELWGLIACHSYGPKGMRVSFPIRKMCRLIGDTASRNIERLSYASRLQARKLINTAPSDKNPSGYIIASSDDLLTLFDADFGMLSIHGETKLLGAVEQSQEALAMLAYLRMRNITSVITSQDLSDDFPDLRYPPGFTVIAGLLYVPLSVGGNDFIVFFRKGQIKEVKWAGNPYEKILREGTQAYLEPRKSFKTWHEMVLGKCREWTEEQVETAAVLCLVYGKFIEVWRQKEAAMQSSHLTRLLLANSAHEVRTPLNAIINYLEIALEGTLDQETRDNLAKSHSASKSLIYVINDLLDLTKTEEGQDLVKDEIFELSACISEATDPFTNEARRKGINYEVTEHPGLPKFVYGDSRRVRQAVSNVAANAVQHTSEGSVNIELYVSEILERRVRIEIVVQDTGRGMSAKQLDALFRDLEQVDMADAPEVRIDEGSDNPSRTLGLGLAMVARTVRNMDGQLRLKSEEGKGSRFVVQFPFDLPDESPASVHAPEHPQPTCSTGGSSIISVPKPDTLDDKEEILLVDRGKQEATSVGHQSQNHAAETFSLDSRKSNKSNRSRVSQGSRGSGGSRGSRGSAQSNLSDAERLIDAIQTPFSLGDGDGPPTLVRRDSREGPSASSMSMGSGDCAARRSLSPSVSRRSGPASPGTLDLPEVQKTTGFATVQDSKTPIRPIKVPDEYMDQPSHPQHSDSSRVLFEVETGSSEQRSESGKTVGSASSGPSNTQLQVLIAEDDPINMRILRKRLEKAGHEVHHAVNGEECATMYRERSSKFDVVLMDMQMPIVDGLTSTKMIRSLEDEPEHGGHSALAIHNGRIPIFAVSASLVEREKDTYVEAGFDGWILKPVDFKRLNSLLLGIVDDEVRNSCLYEEGEWERGGWFSYRYSGEKDSDTLKAGSEAQISPGLDEDGPEQAPDGETTETQAQEQGFVTDP